MPSKSFASASRGRWAVPCLIVSAVLMESPVLAEEEEGTPPVVVVAPVWPPSPEGSLQPEPPTPSTAEAPQMRPVTEDPPMPSVVDAPPIHPAAEEPPMQSVVTASRGRQVGSTPVAATQLSAREVALSASRSADELLRAVPSVSLPRASSQAQHPTAQGVSLRGLGRGRTLVLVDGVPVNDPFGGWVQWNRVPRSQISRVEVVRGASSHLYGSLAMGGVVQLFTRPLEEDALVLEADYGTANAGHAAAHVVGRLSEQLSFTASVDTLRSDGQHTVAQGLRGPVDLPSAFEAQTVGGRVEWRPSSSARAWLSTHYNRELRNGGTALTDNRQWSGDVAAGLSLENGAGRFEASAFGGTQMFHNVNSRVDVTRESETLALRQRIPVNGAGGSLLWTRALGERQQLAVGFDLRWVDATNEEQVYATNGTRTGARAAGGRQGAGGLFAEYEVRPLDALTLTAGLRADGWSNSAGFSVALTGERTALPERLDGALSPRIAAVYRVLPSLALRSTAYGGFRAPNLNELYRGYFAGRVQVIPNPELTFERVYGAEVGTDWSPLRRLTVGATAFLNDTHGRIEQVTLDEQTRQRRNLGASRALGAEVELSWRPLPELRLAAGYTFTSASVTAFAQMPELVGKRLPNVPLHTGAATVSWMEPRVLDLQARIRAESAQYADDRNAFLLPSFAVVDLTVSRRLREEVELYASVSNLLDAEVLTDRDASLQRVAAGRSVWGGFRVRY